MVYRRLQIQRAVRPVAIVVTEELGEQREQMALIQHYDVVKTLSWRKVRTTRSATEFARGVR